MAWNSDLKGAVECAIVDDGIDPLDVVDVIARTISGYDKALGKALAIVWHRFSEARDDADTKAVEAVEGEEFQTS